MTKTKIAITDDHDMVLKGIVSMMENTKELEIVSTFPNAKETKDKIGDNLPDVLLLDINLPDQNGMDLCKELLKSYPNLKIIALSNFDEISFVKGMLQNGAHGYLLKNTDKIEIIKALKTVLSGETYLQKEIKKRLLNQSLGIKKKSQILDKLTRREQEVLEAISEELTTQEISKKLFISPKTVETHRMNLLSKLGSKNSVGMVKVAIEKGLI